MVQNTDALRRTSLYDEHKKLGARIVPFAGWEMPVQYKGIVEEHKAVRTAAGLFDVSHMGEIALKGEHAAAVVDYLITGLGSGIEDGRALYTCAVNDAGMFLDDLIVYRTGRESFLIVCNAGNRDKISAHFEKAAVDHCEFEDRSDEVALIALQGPKALAILATAGSDAEACASLGSFQFRDAVVANVKATVARTGYTGEDGVEIFCASTDAPHLWRTLLELGRPFGIEPVGLGARDTLRLEARLALYGNDIDETTNPLEAGLGRLIAWDKPMFIGKEALLRVKEKGPSRKLVGFEMTGRGIARHGYPLLDVAGKSVGICTSGGPSPTLGKSIGLGYLPVEMTEVGTRFLVDCRGKSIEAVVIKTPFYKRAKGT
jgi:glycine cleavage system T protein (aminomethyltransferase)